ncbi:MAG: DUF2207 domain-containing protein [Candidatus Aminicenantes bacterium]|nr:DUF2207 domain-containing protein [Candidatus Aminicenantes bacterium]
MVKRMIGAGLGALLVFALGLTTPLGAADKKYYFPAVRIEIAVERDGSFLVDEFRTYEFEGSFSWATLWIPVSMARQGMTYRTSVEDFRVLDEDGRSLPVTTAIKNDRFTARWSYKARDERRTFNIRYRVRGAVTSYSDVTELYWQAIGPGWERPTAQAEVTVILPGALARPEDLLVYGHGPLSGRSEVVDARTARFTATDIRSGEMLEVRVLWPPGLVQGAASDLRTLASIREEEQTYVAETIETLRRQEEKRQRTERWLVRAGTLWAGWLIVGPVIFLLIYFRVWSRVGKDYRFEGIPDYLREPPSDLPPASVQVLVREGRTVTPAAFTATLFDLGRRGYIELEDRTEVKAGFLGTKERVETSISCRKDYQQDKAVRPFERDVLDLIFEAAGGTSGKPGARVELADFKSYLKKNPQKFQTWYKAWQKAVKSEVQPLGFIEPQSQRAMVIFLAVALPVAIILFNPVLLVLAGVLTPQLKRRAFPWAQENENWKAFRRFLDDFSEFKEVPAEAYKLWESYLVFGILFGNAKKILQALPLVLKDTRAAVPAWYAGFNPALFATNVGRLESTIASIEHISTSISQAAMSAAHYSSGSGGGFSGGGGGGAGGGGGGAG